MVFLLSVATFFVFCRPVGHPPSHFLDFDFTRLNKDLRELTFG